jgi:light-regulated signal transduction histidine kinase (bacteriophytochrome)
VRQLNRDLEARVLARTADIEVANRELESANRDLEAFTYSVSHDLRTPLRAISGSARILADEEADRLDVEGRQHLRRVREGAATMASLVDDLLAFSRLGRRRVHKRSVDPGGIAREALGELVDERRGRDVEIVLEELPPCQADPGLLKIVYVNLLSNALKYTRGRDHAVIEIGAERSSGVAVYFVKDNGVGFDMRYSEKLFAVFQRLHSGEVYEGTGVGLATVHRIIDRHGGRIWAQAELDRGATFFFEIEGSREPR